MALVKCPECGCDVSEQARSCPNCGHPIVNFKKNVKKLYGNNSFRKKGIKFAIIVVIIIAIIGIISTISEYQKLQEKKPVNQMKKLSQEVANGYLNSFVGGYINSDAQYIDSYMWYSSGKDNANQLNVYHVYVYYAETSKGGVLLTVQLNNWDIDASLSTMNITLSEDFSLYESVVIEEKNESYSTCKEIVKQNIRNSINKDPNHFCEINDSTVFVVYKNDVKR